MTQDMSEQIHSLKGEVERARAVMEPLANFAWSACATDCEESRTYLQSLIDDLRAFLQQSEGQQQ